MHRDIQTSIMKNASVMFASQMVTWISSFVLLLFLPRYLGSKDYGHLYLAISLAMILSVIVDFGGTFLIPKNVSRSPDNAAPLISSYIAVRIMLWLGGIAILWIFSEIVGYSPLVVGLIIILGFAKLWEEIRKAFRSYFQGIERMGYPSIGIIVEKVFISLFAVTALLLGYHSVAIALIMAIGALLDLIVCIIYARRFLPKLPHFNFRRSVGLLKTGLPYFFWSVFAVIYYRVDAVMLSLMTTDNVVGWYGGAYRFFDVFMFFPSILTTVMFPILSKLSGAQEDQLVMVLHKGIKYLLSTGVLVGILVFSFAHQIVVLFLGLKGYTPSINILHVFAFGVPFVYVDFMLGNAIIAADKQRQWAVVGFIAIGINILLNYFLISHTQATIGNGGIGAAIATLLTEVYIMSCAFVLLPGYYFKKIGAGMIFKILISGTVTFGVIWLLKPMPVIWIIKAIIGVAVYGFSLILLNVITRNERHSLQSFLSTTNLKTLISQKG